MAAAAVLLSLATATTNGKLSARYGLSDAVSIRGGISTGFRAPTPGQQNTLNVQTTIDPETLQLVDSANVPSTFRAAQLRGGQPREPETSINTTAGLVVDTGPFTFTADYFRVELDNNQRLLEPDAGGGFTPWGLSGGYYYARLNYGWGG